MSTLTRQPRLTRPLVHDEYRDRYRSIAERYVTPQGGEMASPRVTSDRRPLDVREGGAGHFSPLVPTNKLGFDEIDLLTSEYIPSDRTAPDVREGGAGHFISHSVSASTYALNDINAVSIPPGPSYPAALEHWPPRAHAFHRALARRLAGELSCTPEVAGLVAYNRIVMGAAGPVPAVDVERGPDGTWPAWVASWPGPVTFWYAPRPRRSKPPPPAEPAPAPAPEKPAPVQTQMFRGRQGPRGGGA